MKLTKRSHSSGFIIKTLASIPAGLIPPLDSLNVRRSFSQISLGWGGGEKYIYTHIYIPVCIYTHTYKIRKNMFSLF